MVIALFLLRLDFDMLITLLSYIFAGLQREADKFEHFELGKAKASKVKAPLITDCLAAIECRLEDYIEHHGLLILKGIRLWENPEKNERRVFHANGDGTFFADGEFRNLREEMRQWVPEGSERL